MDATLCGWHASTLSSVQLLRLGARVVICLLATPRLAREALGRQEASVQELLVVRRVPAAYKQCLAECVRRPHHACLPNKWLGALPEPLLLCSIKELQSSLHGFLAFPQQLQK